MKPSLPRRFLEVAARRPDAVALVDDAGATLTYAELAARASALGVGLAKRIASAKPRLVATLSANHAEHVVAMLGVFLSGHVWAPLNAKAARAFNMAVLSRLEPALLLLDQACADAVDPGKPCPVAEFRGGDPTGLDALAAPSASAPPLIDDPTAPMSVKLTGGTTGRSKAVVQTQGMLTTAADDLQAVFRFDADDVNLAVAPLSHGAFHLLFPILLAGGRHEILAHADADAALDLMADRKVSVAFMPPTLIVKLMARPGARPSRFPMLRELIYSAAPMSTHQIAQAEAAFGNKIGVMYGQVEAPVAIAAMAAAEMAETGKSGSVGRPCPTTEVRIDGAVRPGDVGEILAKGPLVADRYLTGEPFPMKEGWLRTGDLGSLDADGHLFIRGRAKEMIISGGFNVYPAEVEAALLAVDGVREVCAFGVDDAYWGERVEAAVIADPGVGNETLIAAAKDAIGAAAAPKRIHRVASLPRNPVGKVVRREVRAALVDVSSTA